MHNDRFASEPPSLITQLVDFERVIQHSGVPLDGRHERRAADASISLDLESLLGSKLQRIACCRDAARDIRQSGDGPATLLRELPKTQPA